MRKQYKLAGLLGAAIMMGGCATDQQMPLIFGQSHTVGISLGAGTTEQGADFVLGYKDKDIAIVPIAIQTGPGTYAQVGSLSGEDFDDSFSVLGQFEVNSGTTEAEVGLGKFFATGAAAKALADGFAAKLGLDQAEGEGE